ncbi:MAG: hypothetical protein AAF628_25710 [Planctomycetota bacterium]
MPRDALLLVAMTGLLSAVAPAPSPASATDVVPVPLRASTEVARTEHFVFHSNPLLNLHHFLYQCAANSARRDGERVRWRKVNVAEMAAADALDGGERAAWQAALDFYRRDALPRSLLFNGRLHTLKGQLSGVEDVAGKWPGTLDPDYAAALRQAWPVYRSRFWPAHRKANEGWVKAVVARLDDHEETLVRAMTVAYGGTWPDGPVRVDVCAYANWAGAYTSDEPAHITVSSLDANNRGDAALETLFHEVSHTDVMFSVLQGELGAAFAARDTEPPRDLWHLFIFVTAGDAVQRALAASGDAGYTHYGERTGLYRRDPWGDQWPWLREHWIAYLDGRIDRATALARITAAAGA